MIKEFRGDFIQWLRGFYFVATTGSVSAAATKMNRNQPAISHQVKSLEEELGVTLFDRSKSRMTLTPEGQDLLDYAITIFEILKEVRATIGRPDPDICGPINIATTHAINTYYLPGYIIPFQQANPGVFFNINGGPLANIMSRIDSTEADFGIASLNETPDSVHYDELFQTRLVLISPKDDVFEIGEKLTIDTFRKLPLVSPPSTSTIHDLIQKLGKDLNFDWNIVQTLNSFALVKRYTQLGMGVSIIDEFAVYEDREKFNIYPLDEFFPPRSYGIIVRKRKYLAPQVRSFIKFLKLKGPEFDLRNSCLD